MTDRKIKVKIDPAGRPTIEAEGFTGSSCTAATKPIEDAFRGGDFDRNYRPEYHQVDHSAENTMGLEM
jgi:hypothetical protein